MYAINQFHNRNTQLPFPISPSSKPSPISPPFLSAVDADTAEADTMATMMVVDSNNALQSTSSFTSQLSSSNPISLSTVCFLTVTMATRVPHHALILSLLSLASLIFLLDGLTFVVYAVLNKFWPQNTGIEVNVILGIVAFSGLAAFGAWKDVHGIPV
jgi:hypothetical protein